MILHEKGHSSHVTIAREVPLFPARLEQQYEARKMAAETPDRKLEFLWWWDDQCKIRELPRVRVSAESMAILARLLRKYEFDTLKGAALMVLNNNNEALAKGYAHHMRFLASRMPDALAMLKRWERKDD